MTGKQRDALLASMTDEVGRLVLADNYQQTQAIALEAAAAVELIEAHGRLIRSLEARGALHRGIEFLPDDKGLGERAAAETWPDRTRDRGSSGLRQDHAQGSLVWLQTCPTAKTCANCW
jgi:NAD-specific glutamate dehydrogenase